MSFVAEFEPLEEKTFTYEEQPAPEEKLFTRTAWVGAERVRDIVNDYDTAVSYTHLDVYKRQFPDKRRFALTIGRRMR